MQPNTTGPNGASNLCYFRQPSKASIALTCYTGQCLYENNDAPQPVPPPEPTPLVSVRLAHAHSLLKWMLESIDDV